MKHEVTAHSASFIISCFSDSGMHTPGRMSAGAQVTDKNGTFLPSVHFTLGLGRKMPFTWKQAVCYEVRYKLYVKSQDKTQDFE